MLYHDLSTCMVDNPLSKACGLSPHTGMQTMLTHGLSTCTVNNPHAKACGLPHTGVQTMLYSGLRIRRGNRGLFRHNFQYFSIKTFIVTPH